MNPRKGLLHYGAEFLLFLILAAVLVFAIQLIPKENLTEKDNSAPLAAYPPPATNTPGPTVTSPPYPPPGGAAAEPTATYVKPPLCQFGGGPMPEASGPTLDDYVFSEPQVVLTSTGNIDLVEWLPDNQRILTTHDIPNKIEQPIELFNPQTGETQVIAVRKYNLPHMPPVWLQALNAVAYLDLNIPDINTPNVFTRQLWISRGDPQAAQMVADGLSSFYLAGSLGGSQIAYLSNKQLALRDASSGVSRAIDFDPSQWLLSNDDSPWLNASYEMAWQPGASQIAFYTDADGGSFFFLADSDTGELCEVNLGGWAAVARWSQDGRYLAAARVHGPVGGASSSDLAVLDTVTGVLYTMTVTPPEMEGQHYVNDIAWAPDSRHLAVIGAVYASPGSGSSPDYDFRKHRGLYLVDFILGQKALVQSTYLYGGGVSGTNLAWSPDGSQLVAACPSGVEERLCLISVQGNDKP